MTKCEIKTLDKDYKSKSYFKKPYAVLFRFFQLKIKIFYLLDFLKKNCKKNCHNNITQLLYSKSSSIMNMMKRKHKFKV